LDEIKDMDEDRKEIIIETVVELLSDEEGPNMDAVFEIIGTLGLTDK